MAVFEMKKIVNIILIIIMSFYCVGCSKLNNSNKEIVPQASQVKSICELATMKCYYHNVAKYKENDASGALWWKKDRNFWIEYTGIVTLGVDVSLVNIEVDDETVEITIPPAKVLSCEVDAETLNENSFVVSKNSAKVEAEHQTEAFKQAQAEIQQKANNDTVLLANAQKRAQKLLEDYINNIGICTGKDYKIKWIYIEEAEKLNNVDINESLQMIEQ